MPVHCPSLVYYRSLLSYHQEVAYVTVFSLCDALAYDDRERLTVGGTAQQDDLRTYMLQNIECNPAS